VASLEEERKAEQEFACQLLEAQEHERRRLAGELHDGLVQSLLVAKNRSLLAIRHAADLGRLGKELSGISYALSDAINEVREIAHNLRPYQLDRLGLTSALRSLADTMNESSSTRFLVDIVDIDDAFTPEAGAMVYRIVQECVNNVLTHAHASEAIISVTRGPAGVAISVRDNGRGWSVRSPMEPRKQGIGLSGIDQRARMLGGTLCILTSETHGTTVSVSIPVHRAELPCQQSR
jgi:signal transduction histidine kinase